MIALNVSGASCPRESAAAGSHRYDHAGIGGILQLEATDTILRQILFQRYLSLLSVAEESLQIVLPPKSFTSYLNPVRLQYGVCLKRKSRDLTMRRRFQQSRAACSQIILLSFIWSIWAATTSTSLAADQPNIVYVLCDDHRWDAMSMMGHPFLETPHLDKLADDGVQFTHAFVTTSLCSPSRASILTGLYTHNHGVSDNYNPVDPQLKFFPEYLQRAGYETAFIGKWHMGDDDEPQRGFDHWVAFRGQGTYYADGHGTTRVVPQTRYDGFNINGKKRVPQKGYITDELTDYALEWLDQRKQKKKPFFLYVSHKAVHSDFVG